LIIQSNNFSLKQIADSGQCFRMNLVSDNKYSLIAHRRAIELTQLTHDTIEINCSNEDYELLWKDYFDIEFNYEEIVKYLIEGEDEFLKRAAAFGSGLRIVKQEPFEALISFIISQNKNIPAIKNSIERLCELYGELQDYDEDPGNIKQFYAFPTPEALASAKKEDLKKTGIGYRDEYVIKAAQAVYRGDLDLNKLKNGSIEEALKEMKCLFGVGEKVANCVSLYGLHHIDAVPIDLWIARILKDVYDNVFDWDRYKGYAGIVQQYMFLYIRLMDKVRDD
jgi:N-glycosylase/DNA lyase